MLAVMMENLKEKYNLKNLVWEIKNNLVLFSGIFRKTRVAGYVGEKAITWDINLKFNEIRIMNEDIEQELEKFFKMLENIVNK